MSFPGKSEFQNDGHTLKGHEDFSIYNAKLITGNLLFNNFDNLLG